MKKRVVRIFTIIFFSIFGIFGFVNAQNSSDERGITISPLVFEISSDPGDKIENKLKVFNQSDDTLNVKMKVEDFVPVGEEGKVVLEEPENNSTYSIARWTKFKESEFTLAPREQKHVDFVIDVPSNAEPGGHYGSVLALLSHSGAETSGSVIGIESGALILIKVSGDVEESLGVEEFSTLNFREKGPIDFLLRFRNDGNVHARPVGFVTISNHFGSKVAEISIPQNNVMPDSIRKSLVNWEKENLFGFYTATLTATYGSSNQYTVSEVVTFTVIPWKKLALILGIILVVILLLYKIRGRLLLAYTVLVKGKK